MPDHANGAAQDNFKSFTTAHIPQHERLEYWEAHNADALIGLDIRTLHTQALEAQQQNRESSTVRAAKVFGSSQLVERSPQMIRKYPTDAVALFFCLQGDSFFCDDNGTQLLHAGEVLACDADSTFIRGFGVGVSEMVLTVSREEFAKVSGRESLTDAKKFSFGPSPEQQPRTADATGLAQWVNGALSSIDNDSELLEDDCLHRLETLFQGATADSTQLFEQAQRFMTAHLSSPDLRRSDIAHLLHMSERQVARLYTANDTSFSRELMGQRIRAAELLMHAEPNTPLAEIAGRCGFRSAAYFSRTFRDIVGYSPTEALRGQSV